MFKCSEAEHNFSHDFLLYGGDLWEAWEARVKYTFFRKTSDF